MNCKLFSCISFLLSTLPWRFLDLKGGSKIIRTPQRYKMNARVFLSFNRIRRLTPAFARAHGGHSYISQFSDNRSDTTPKTHEGKRITLIGGAVNLGMAIGSASVGYVSGSSSLMAHAVHSFSDLAGDAMTFMSIKFAAAPFDAEYPYGRGHFETLGTLGVSTLLVFSAGGVGMSALESLVEIGSGSGTELAFQPVALATAAAGFGAKEWLFYATLKVAKQQRSSVLVANAWHHRSDALSSLVAIGGVGGAILGLPGADAAGGLLVSGLVGKMGVDLGWGAIRAMTDAQTNARVLDGVAAIGSRLAAENEIKGLANIRCRQLGAYCLVDCSILVDPNLSVKEAHERSNKLREAVTTAFPEVHDVMTHLCPAVNDGNKDNDREGR